LTLAPLHASAGTIIWYQGTTYTSIGNRPEWENAYDRSMRMTGWIELADPLAPDSSYTFWDGDPGLLRWMFFDGLQHHYTELGVELHFGTDSLARITSWDVWGYSTGGYAPLGGSDLDFNLSSLRGRDVVSELCDNCDPSIVRGVSSSRPGKWAVVPEPATSALVAIGIAVIGVGRYRTRGLIRSPLSQAT
jgi:hypothetical protein